jgi:hypothetical protein
VVSNVADEMNEMKIRLQDSEILKYSRKSKVVADLLNVAVSFCSDLNSSNHTASFAGRSSINW